MSGERIRCCARCVRGGQWLLVDHRPCRQCRLQLDRERHRLGKDVGIVHGHRRGFGELLAESGGMLIEDVLGVVGVDVDREAGIT